MNVALELQQLGSSQDRVLVLGQLASLRNDDGWFATREVTELFEALRLPSPSNVSDVLGKLRKADLVVKAKSGNRWSLSPLGQSKVQQIALDVADLDLVAQGAGGWGAELGHAQHTTIPPNLAPAKWRRAITQLNREFPFEQSIFCMTRFPVDATDTDYLDPVSDAIQTLRNVATAHGLTVHLASDRVLDEDLFGNIAAHMWACKFGVGLFEDLAKPKRGLNYNLVIEVGAMLSLGRRCALLKDPTSPNIPTDFIGQIYKTCDLANVDAVSEAAHAWLADDLGLGRCPACPSSGA